MKITGIVAEYNPFHSGHMHQLDEIRKHLNADHIIVFMSGDFVQRGAPAIADKYTRAKMALCSGADMVFELPVLYATASAEYFSTAAVTAFDKMNIVDSICFGCETPDRSGLLKIAGFLSDEPAKYKQLLNQRLKEGLSFPAARARALSDCDIGLPQEVVAEILAEPNNILAIEYCKAIIRRNSPIIPEPIIRRGGHYHSTELDKNFSSASAIRNTLTDPELILNKNTIDDISRLKALLGTSIPKRALDIFITEAVMRYGTCTVEDFSSILYYSLLMSSKEQLAGLSDSSIEISNRIVSSLSDFTGFSDFTSLIKSRQLTHTRVSRVLMHSILNIPQALLNEAISQDHIPYLRLLGFRKEASPLLGRLKKECALPIVTRPREAKDLKGTALEMFRLDVRSSQLYRGILSNKSGIALPDEDHMPMLVL